MKGMSLIFMIFVVIGIFYGYQISPKLTFYNDDDIEITLLKPSFGDTIYNDSIELRWEFYYPEKKQNYVRLIVRKDGNTVFDYEERDPEFEVPSFWYLDKNTNLDGDGDYTFELWCGYYVPQGSGDYAIKSISFPLTLASPQEDTVHPPIPEVVEAYHIGDTDPRRTWVKATDLSSTVDDLDHYVFWWGSSADYDNSAECPTYGYIIEGTDQYDTLHVAVSAVDKWGNESSKSPDFVVVDTVIDPPQPPNPPDVPEDPNDPHNNSPVASFTMNKSSFVVGETITCISLSYDPNGDTIQHRWFFDGDEVTQIGDRIAFIVAGSERKIIQHTFRTAGLHVIKLEVSDGYFTKSITRTVTVFNSSVTNQENVGEQDWSNQNIVIERKKSIFEYLKDPIFFMIFTIVVVLFVYVVILRRKR